MTPLASSPHRYRPPLVWRAGDATLPAQPAVPAPVALVAVAVPAAAAQESERREGEREAGSERARDGGNDLTFAEALALSVGPLSPLTGIPVNSAHAVWYQCDPGTGGGQCPLLVVQEGPRHDGELRGWEQSGEARASDAAWWKATGARLGAGAPLYDADAMLPARGDGDVLAW